MINMQTDPIRHILPANLTCVVIAPCNLLSELFSAYAPSTSRKRTGRNGRCFPDPPRPVSLCPRSYPLVFIETVVNSWFQNWR